MSSSIANQNQHDHLRPQHKATPLPKLQITIILLMRLAEPLSFSIIFPFISQMVEEELGVVSDKSQVGFYAGLIESIFSLAQAALILHWARLSDRIGRKKVILMGLSGVALSNLFFGFSKSLIWAIVSRTIMGALNGNVAVVTSLLSELSDKTNRALAFSLYSGTWGIAFTLGSLLGGYLSKPVLNLPDLFGKGSPFYFLGLFEVYPYALPCLTASFVTFFSFLLGLVFLKETHPGILRAREEKNRREREGTEESQVVEPLEIAASVSGSAQHEDVDEDEDEVEPPQSSTVWELLRNPHIRTVMLTYSYLSVSQVCTDAALVLFLYTPVRLGGLAFKSKQTGIFLALVGIISALIQLLLFPLIQKRYGTKRIFVVAMSCWIAMAGILPICNSIARNGMVGDGDGEFDEVVGEEARIWVWLFLAIAGFFKVVSGLSFACNTILINESAKLLASSSDSSSNLGNLNGLGVTIGSIMRTIGPALTSSVYALSVSKQILGGQLIWWGLVGVGILGVNNTLLIRDFETEEEEEEQAGEDQRGVDERDETTPLLRGSR